MKRKSSFILQLFFLMTFSSWINGFGQNAEVFSKINAYSYDQDWVLYQENDQISIYYKYVDCAEPQNDLLFEYLLFRVENKTLQTLDVFWNWEYSYNNVPRPAESDDEVGVFLDLPPNNDISANCSPGNQHNLKLFVRDRKRPETRQLTGFSIENIEVNQK